MTWVTAPLGPKGQITLPKRIREVLGLKEKGDRVGFILDDRTGAVRLTRMEIRPIGEDYSQEELKKLMRLSNTKGKKKSASAEDFLKSLEKL